jgi:hypothetical protein
MRLLWQAGIAALVLLGLFWAITSAINPGIGDPGFNWHSTAGGLTIESVDPGTQAAREGLHAGQTIQVEPTFAELVYLSSLRAGDKITFGREDGTRFTLTAQPADVPLALNLIVVMTRVSFLLVAALVAWRRPEDPAARALATFLACFGAAINLGTGLWGGPAGVRLASLLVDSTLFIVGIGAVTLFACRFPTSDPSGWRRALERSVLPLTAFGITLSLASGFLAYVFRIDYHTKRLFVSAHTLYYTLMLVAALAALVQAYRSAGAASRIRMLWVLGTFAVGFSGLIAQLVGTVLAGSTPSGLAFAPITVIAIPIGLSYVILRHRVLDIGFVINRAAVYTAVSLIIVGAFIVFEWLLTHVVEAGGTASTALQLGAALALGLSARFIHTHVDRYIDDLFFRDRHLAEAAIRRFAHEALLITDADDLAAKTVDVAQEKARLSAVAYYIRQDGRYVPIHSTFQYAPDVSENDYAVLDMRTWHQRIELLDRRSQVPGEIAFPMIVRGNLAGFLACGAKTTHEALAPDESDALALLARDAGISFDSLRVHALERELERLIRVTKGEL